MTVLRTSRLVGAGLVGAVAIIATVGLQLPAAAHNFIVSSTPTENETLTALPEKWQITTNDDLLVLNGVEAGFALIVSDADGAFYGDGCIDIEGATLSMPAALGADGAYTLTYQFISADGHTLSGVLPFVWQAPAEFDAHVGLVEQPVCGQTESAPAPEQAPIAEPDTETNADPAINAEPIEPISDSSPALPLFIAGVFAVVVSIAGLLTAVILRARARNRSDETRGPDDAD